MSLGRRKAQLLDPQAWVFNRMADVYGARPEYPMDLLEAVGALAGEEGARVIELGAGIGHVALPLAEQGLDVVAVEPAEAMLERLKTRAVARGISIKALHATAEALPLPSGSADLIVIADALHFLDVTLSAGEVARVLAPRGALAIITSEFSDTAWMRGLTQLMEEAAPRRPRQVSSAITQMFRMSRISAVNVREYADETPVDSSTLEEILRSISFIGPAMNPERFERFRTRVHALVEEPVWARRFTLYSGRQTRA